MKARLQLADPVPARGQREARIRLEVCLEARLVELRIVEGVERRRQAPQCTDQLQLARDDVGDEAEPYLACEFQSGLGFPLNVWQWLAGSQQVGDEIVAAIRREGEVADLIGRVESAPYQGAAAAHVLRPRIDEVAKGHVDTGFEAVEAATLDQLEAELPEAEPRRVVVEIGARDHAEPDVSETRGATVAVLEADVGHAAQDQAEQVVIREQGRRDDLG